MGYTQLLMIAYLAVLVHRCQFASGRENGMKTPLHGFGYSFVNAYSKGPQQCGPLVLNVQFPRLSNRWRTQLIAALGAGISAFGARPEPIIATARISTTAPGDNSALVPTALHAG